MASTKADNNRVAWAYTDDDSTVYAISAKAVYVLDPTDGAKYGGQAAAADDRRIPKDLKPRKVKCVASGQPDKWIVVYEKTAALWTTVPTTVTLDANGVDVSYTNTSRRRHESYRDTTRQTS